MKKLPLLVIDARSNGHSFRKYAEHIAQGLPKDRPYRVTFLVSRETRDHPHFGAYDCVEVGGKFLRPTEWVTVPAALLKLGASLFHSPTYDSLPVYPCPWLMTIHDLNHLTYGSAAQKIYYSTVLKRAATGARQLMTVSEYSRDAIAKWLGVSGRDIEVVYNAFDPPTPASPPAGLTPGRYFFTLSSDKAHKNIPMLARAYERYKQSHPDAWPWVVRTGHCSDTEARDLMAHCAGFLFPSLYEGFGRPPIEAALLGAPVVASDIPPHREGLSPLHGEKVEFIDPRNEDAWVEAFAKLQRGEIARPSEQGRWLLQESFSVARLGNHMDRIYRRVLRVGDV